jgi:crotonobetainyl-CoA:carnitine CoA-transferase CaiB-like acyl-CoA transferase
MVLADLGADVVKVERPGVGDETRTWGPPFVEGESAYFLAVNRDKRSIALDLSSEPGGAAFLRLAARADVLVENFRAGGAEVLGVGYEQCAPSTHASSTARSPDSATASRPAAPVTTSSSRPSRG